MKKPIMISILLLLTIGGSLLQISCGGNSDAKLADENSTRRDVVSVRVEEVKFVPFVDALQVTGVIQAYEDVKLSPEEGGVVKEWKVRKGQWVEKGTLLVILKDDLLQASADAASAQFNLAEINYEKQKQVFSEQGISELQLKSLQFNRDAAKAQADLALARLEHARVRSPINGILNEEYYEAGEFAPPGMPIAHLVNVSRLKVSAEIPERYAGTVTPGASVKIIPDSQPEDSLSGKISFVAASVSPDNRTLPIEVILPNPGHKLKPETIARVRILRSVQNHTVLINENIVQLVDRNRIVVYIEKNGKAEERVVKLGGRQGKRVEILEGLKPGERVIVSGFQNLVNDQPVLVIG